MEFSIATLLSHFSDNKLVAGKVLEKKLGCDDEENVQKLQIVLDVLEKIGILVKEFGKYRRSNEEDVVEAKLRCSSKGFCFAIQDKEGADDIYIRESNLSSAWNGDRVLVKIIKEGSRRRSPEGEVKLILERANPSLLARIIKDNGNYRAVPLDDRLLFELVLHQNGENLEGAVDHLVHVAVKRYPLAQNPPIGKVTRILGSDAEEAADTDIVCCKHDLPQTFPNKVIDSLKTINTTFDEEEIAKRRDLRGLLTVAVGQENISFIENALSLEKNTEGQWQLGIHTTDVAHYVPTESPLDREAKKRGTSVRIGERILPIFPEEITNLCSLSPEKDTLAISVFITLDERGEIAEFEIIPSVVRVDYQFTAEQVQSLLSLEEVEPAMIGVREMLNQLFLYLSPLVKAQRLQNGGFEIALDEQPCLFNDEGRLGAIIRYSSLPVRSSLTELMVLVGKIVAQHLVALSLPAIYCVQTEPDWDELEDLLKLGVNLGLDLTLESEEEIKSIDYQHLVQEFTKSSDEKVLLHLLKGTLKLTKYVTKPGKHFGLSCNTYTHCVSPGQRYADLMVQRVLKALFDQGRDRRHSNVKEGVILGSSHCHSKINWKVLPTDMQEELESELAAALSVLNDREKLADDAENDLQGLKKAEKMKERTGQIFEGLITGVQSYGFFVEIEDLLVEGLVHVSSLKDDWYEYRARHSCLVGRKNRIAYRLGDRVEVEVKSVDYYRQQIDLVTVRGGSDASDEDLEED
jgi:ribonuclease R